MIADSALVAPDAAIGADVSIGAYSVIGAGVEIGAGCRIGSHVVIDGPTRIGEDNRIFPFSAIGGDPQDKKYVADGESRLVIGAGNTLREFCTINRGTAAGGGATVIGDHNWLMAYVHIAHDCVVGDHTVFANNATLAGHARVEDRATLGGFTGVHQFCRVGAYAFTAIASVALKDVPPFLMVSGNPARPGALNRVGLRRHGFAAERVETLKRAYKSVYRKGLLLKDALAEIQGLIQESGGETADDLRRFHDFIRASERGIVR